MEPSKNTSALNYKTIVILDDQKTARDVHAAIIRSFNLPYQVKIVPMQNAKETLEWMSGKSVDLVISHYLMADTTFDAFTKSISNIYMGKRRPKHIMITASLEDQENYRYPVSAYLQKPVKRNTLEPLVSRLLVA